jgi:hypothetical protein
MDSRLYRSALFALYQLSLLFGITMLPLAILARQFGVTLPVHRAIDRLGEAYDEASEPA